MIDLVANPLGVRQQAEYQNALAVVEKFGQYGQSSGADGAGYEQESDQSEAGVLCANCVQFSEGLCAVVSGEIAAAGLCRLYIIPETLLTSDVSDVSDVLIEIEVNAAREGSEREVRELKNVEVRAAADGTKILEGYATVYNFAYPIGDPAGGGFVETIVAGAATKSASEADVRLLINHEGVPLARTKSGTMTLTSDDIGLRVTAVLDAANPTAVSLASAMERGDMDQMSFAFKVLRDEWNSDYTERKIFELKLFDVSMVTYPANPATVAKVRHDETVSETASGRSVEMAKRQLEAITARR